MEKLKYVDINKDTYLIEIDEHLSAKLPPEFEFISRRKGYKRFKSPEVSKILRGLNVEEMNLQSCISKIFKVNLNILLFKSIYI